MRALIDFPSEEVGHDFLAMEIMSIFLLLLAVTATTGEEAGDGDGLSIPTVNCMDEYHFCFGAKGNETSVNKRHGCLKDMTCDVLVIADASNVKRIHWNLQMRNPSSPLNQTEKLVAFFYLSPDDVCTSCVFEPGLTPYFNVPPGVLVVEYMQLPSVTKLRQFVMSERKDDEGRTMFGARDLVEERSSDTTFDLQNNLVAPTGYWGIIFNSGRKLTYAGQTMDILRDGLHPHLVLMRVWNNAVAASQVERIEVMTNVGLPKFLIFSDKDNDVAYRSQVRAWVVRIIMMLVLLLLIAIGCVFYYRSQVHFKNRKHVSPDNINDIFDQ